jgi:hypothetical protein
MHTRKLKYLWPLFFLGSANICPALAGDSAWMTCSDFSKNAATIGKKVSEDDIKNTKKLTALGHAIGHAREVQDQQLTLALGYNSFAKSIVGAKEGPVDWVDALAFCSSHPESTLKDYVLTVNGIDLGLIRKAYADKIAESNNQATGVSGTNVKNVQSIMDYLQKQDPTGKSKNSVKGN